MGKQPRKIKRKERKKKHIGRHTTIRPALHITLITADIIDGPLDGDGGGFGRVGSVPGGQLFEADLVVLGRVELDGLLGLKVFDLGRGFFWLVGGFGVGGGGRGG